MTQTGYSVSVITAAFNAARFLPECLESVCKQQSKLPLEHIVIDGGSTDGTLDVLKDRAAEGVSLSFAPSGEKAGPFVFHTNPCSRVSPSYSLRFLSEPDQGQCDAFNKGVAMATGDWICWLNADDKLAPGAISAFDQALAAHPDADVIYGHVQFIHEDSSPAWVSYHLPFWYPLILNGCYTPPSVGTFFRRDLLLREPLDIDYHYVMDVEWFLRCGRNLKAICADQVLSHFRISDNAKTSEMIRSGQITERHREERENYRRKHVYSQWSGLPEDRARKKFERRQRLFLWLYRAMKMRYAWRYLAARKG